MRKRGATEEAGGGLEGIHCEEQEAEDDDEGEVRRAECGTWTMHMGGGGDGKDENAWQHGCLRGHEN